MLKTIGYTLGGLALLGVITFGLNGAGLINLKFWGVQYQDAKTDIFEQTKSYKHGTIRDIENLCLEMERTNDLVHKRAIRSVLNHRISNFDRRDIPAHLMKCVNGQN